MRDRVGGDIQLQAVLLLYGLDVWMKKKVPSNIQMFPTTHMLGCMDFHSPASWEECSVFCSESWVSSNGFDSFSAISVKMSQPLGLETRHAFQVP